MLPISGAIIIRKALEFITYQSKIDWPIFRSTKPLPSNVISYLAILSKNILTFLFDALSNFQLKWHLSLIRYLWIPLLPNDR